MVLKDVNRASIKKAFKSAEGVKETLYLRYTGGWPATAPSVPVAGQPVEDQRSSSGPKTIIASSSTPAAIATFPHRGRLLPFPAIPLTPPVG